VDRLAGVRLLLLRPVLRDREDELFVDRPLDEDERDVLELRDPGGEDVRVAMVRAYVNVTPATGITLLRVGREPIGLDHVTPRGGGTLDL